MGLIGVQGWNGFGFQKESGIPGVPDEDRSLNSEGELGESGEELKIFAFRDNHLVRCWE